MLPAPFAERTQHTTVKRACPLAFAHIQRGGQRFRRRLASAGEREGDRDDHRVEGEQL
jgi:hypothetical protein